MRLLITTQAVDRNDPILGFFHGWILELAKHFERIDIICLKKGVYELPHHVHVHTLGKEEGENHIKYLYRFYLYFAQVFFGIRVNYVFYHMGAIYNILGLPFFVLRRLFGTEFYWWKTHGQINLTGRVASFFIDSIFTASEGSFPIDTKKRKIVGHAIGMKDISLVKKSLNNNIRLCYVGRISRIKRVDILIDLAKILNSTNMSFSFECIGPVIDEEYFRELESLIQKNDLSQVFVFKGPVNHSELPNQLKKIDVLVHSSETGSIDKVVLEAMSQGVIPIALCSSYGTFLSEYGLCVSNNAPVEYYKIIEKIISLNTSDYNKLRVSLHAYVCHAHSLDTLPQRIFRLDYSP